MVIDWFEFVVCVRERFYVIQYVIQRGRDLRVTILYFIAETTRTETIDVLVFDLVLVIFDRVEVTMSKTFAKTKCDFIF